MIDTSSKEKKIYGMGKSESSSSEDQLIKKLTEHGDKIDDMEKGNKKIQDIVYLGFIIILITFIATIFGLICFIIQNQIALSHVVDINSKYSNILNIQEQIVKDLEQAVKENEKIEDDVNASKEIEKCIKYKGYFSIQCFNDN
jgi:hypothetical protein